MMKNKRAQLFLALEIPLVIPLVILGLLLFSAVAAQTAATTKRGDAGPLIVEPQPSAPQVVTVLHKLNGLKMLRLLLRSGQAVGAVATMDDAFEMTGKVHTNIIAGLTLDDGQTIVAWLPEAEVEVESPFPPMARPKVFDFPLSASTVSSASTGGFAVALPGAPDLMIVERDGQRHTAHYIGLDGITGLSLLKLSGQSLPVAIDANGQELSVGQRMRLFSPEPAPRAGSNSSTSGASSAIYVRIGETAGQVVSIARDPAGRVSRIRVKSAKLSRANIGAIAVNDSGQTVGIVDDVEGSEAGILPAAVIRGATQRVMAHQSSVPRPWLGVRGEPVAGTALEQILRNGWKRQDAMSLFGDRRGILLTSVVPGSPAAQAALRPGDVILQVNNGEVQSEDDFSSLLDEAGGGNPVRFTVVRPDRVGPEALVVKLSQSLDRLFAARMLTGADPRGMVGNPLLARGIETIAIGPRVGTRPGSSRGLLVVYVQPEVPAFKAGLRPGDVIEALNGRFISTTTAAETGQILKTRSYTLNVVRNKQKLVFTVVTPQK
jgi:S1-C subfamily serine protease